MEKYLLALDQGTTSSRAIIFDKEGHIKAKAQKEFTQLFPQPGWVEHNPKEIWQSQSAVIVEAMTKMGITEESIVGIGITNQRETTIVWDAETGEPVLECKYEEIINYFCHGSNGLKYDLCPEYCGQWQYSKLQVDKTS